MTEQHFNRSIKRICKEAELCSEVRLPRRKRGKMIFKEGLKCDFISAHTARRTFVSIMLNTASIPMTAVMKITGHKKLSTLNKYIHITADQVGEAFKKSDTLL